MQKRLLMSAIAGLMILGSSFVYAEKPEQNRKMEILQNEVEETYRFADMRVSRETGAPIALYRVNYPVQAGSPEAMAQQYLRENAALLHIDTDNLTHFATLETPGGYRVRFQQMAAGYKVYKSTIVVSLNRNNEVVFVMSSYKPRARLSSKAATVALKAASGKARAYLGIQGQLQHQEEETLVYYNQGVTRLAHRIQLIPAEDMFGDWEVLVDAQNGELFRVEDRAVYDNGKRRVDGTGMVFDPDPLTRARATYQTGGQFGDNNDADTDSLNANRAARTLRDITQSGPTFSLNGPYAVISDHESPFKGLFSQNSSDWNFTRSADAFEAANVYFHIDASMRYLNETLGFAISPFQYTGGARVDPHGLGGDDNSHYLSNGTIAWGEGGVDDSEDPDVIWHELMHGIHDWATNGGLSNNQGISEGMADYWADSYNRSSGFWTPADPQYYWTFQWDGHNQFWNGRVNNTNRLYPGGLGGGVHADGEIICAALMLINEDIGRIACDSDLIEAISMTNGSAGQLDIAQAFVQADINLYGGANLGPIAQHLTARGYNITIPTPQITHTPLADTEDLNGPYLVEAVINPSGNPIAVARLIFGTNGVFTDSVDMNNTGGNNYSAQIPGTGVATDYNYYIFVADNGGLATTVPAGAPGNFFSFSSGLDTESPVITHNPLGDQALLRWPASVNAVITDNIGISLAEVVFSVNNGAFGGTFQLANTSGNNYSAAFPIDASQLAEGDLISYVIYASDLSTTGNLASNPPSGMHEFSIVASRGLVLVIDDDAAGLSTNGVTTEKGFYQRDLLSSPLGLSANTINNQLNGLGYTAVLETVANTDPATWDAYNLIISSSGINESPVADAAYRAAIENWVNSDPGNKLLIEGGEVGYDAADFPGYPSFAQDVIHSDDWFSDNAGPFNLVSGQSSHPMVTTPHQLPAQFPISYTAFGSEDAVNAIGGAYVIYEPANNPGNAGISVYDPDSDPGSAQIVFFAVNYAQLSDTVAARHLLENAVEYLLTPEPSVGIGGDNTASAPQEFALYANYPNPFNPSTTIRYDLKSSVAVRLTIYNMIGQEVRTLVDAPEAAGSRTVVWNGRDNSGEAVSSGIYLLRLEAGSFVQTRKMILLK